MRQLPRVVEPGWGYDGQFYAQLALDPLLRSDDIATALDNPAYRGRRILLSWVAFLAGGGEPWLVLQAYAALNVVRWIALAWLLLRWLPPGTQRTTLAWAACLLSHGTMSSVRLALPDFPSMLLLALAIRAIEKNRTWLAAGVLDVAGLAKETNLLGGAVLPAAARPDVRSAVRLAGQTLFVIAPLAAWLAYLWGLGLSSGGTGARAFALPLSAYAEKWVITVAELQSEGWSSIARFSLLTLIASSTQAIVLLWYRDRQSPWWRMGVAYLVLMVFLGGAVGPVILMVPWGDSLRR